MADTVAAVPDHRPYTDDDFAKNFRKSPKEFWHWLTSLNWEKIRHDPPKDDVREDFADTLVYQELLREIQLFLDKDNANLLALMNAILKAFGESVTQEWANQFREWSTANKDILKGRVGKEDMLAGLKSMPLPDLGTAKKTYGTVKVGIVGGGIAGLYAGRLFDWLNQHLADNPKVGPNGEGPLKFEFEILEAANRVGGRIYTHHFSPNQHDYFDVGAMRFPDTKIMKRQVAMTFDLFEDVGLYKSEIDIQEARKKAAKEEAKKADKSKISGSSIPNFSDENHSDGPKKLLKYLLSSDRTPKYFNDVQHYDVLHEKDPKTGEAKIPAEKEPEANENELNSYPELKRRVDYARQNPRGPEDGGKHDTYGISTRKHGDVPYAYVVLGQEALLKYAFEPFKYLLRYEFYVGYQALMRFESYSVRQFLSRICKFDFYTINWLETSDSATGWFDLAFTEAVIESFTFSAPKVCVNSDEGSDHHHQLSPDTDWYCVEGGTGEVVRRLNDKVSGEPEYNQVVVKMKLNREAEDENKKMEVYLKDEGKTPRQYHTVINTTTLGCASRMDLKEVELQTGQKTAIRMLRYSASTKIGIKFTDPWWIQKPFYIDKGGVAASDLYSARMCVYPSYNIHDPTNRPAVLLASYCWGQDAERVGSMMKKTSPEGEEVLRDCLLRDLARLHHDEQAPSDLNMSYEKVLTTLRKKYITHYSYDWNHDSFVSGAFAMFGPGQYRKMMPHLQRPTADSRLHFAGEATSNHHAWIVGSLESSLRSVCHLLIKTGHWDLLSKKGPLFHAWGRLPGFNKKIFFWQYVLGLLPPANQKTGLDIVQEELKDDLKKDILDEFKKDILDDFKKDVLGDFKKDILNALKQDVLDAIKKDVLTPNGEN
ncbi:hypothetical protein TWF481_006280 [Arthrobotrys musiformis]|uniref:Amine oxidase domain-containing protein n=1 Tax=Arthrobotrys musiformis TaxID=47236 RepID=A0AAV9WG98_9PEZI